MTIMAPVDISECIGRSSRSPCRAWRISSTPARSVPLHARDKSGVLAASGEIDGVRTIAYCSDATVMGGAMGVDGCKHIVNAIDTAIDAQIPDRGHLALRWRASGRGRRGTARRRHWSSRPWSAHPASSPRFRSSLGFAAGGAAYGPALTDVVIMAPEGRVFVTGPDVVRSRHR